MNQVKSHKDEAKLNEDKVQLKKWTIDRKTVEVFYSICLFFENQQKFLSTFPFYRLRKKKLFTIFHFSFLFHSFFHIYIDHISFSVGYRLFDVRLVLCISVYMFMCSHFTSKQFFFGFASIDVQFSFLITFSM